MTPPESTAPAPGRAVDRTAAMRTLVVGALVFVVAAALLVPWNVVPGGGLDPVRADTVFTPDQIARAESFSAWARTWSYLSLAISLAVACWFGFTTRGARLVARLPGPWWVQVPLAVAALELIGRVVTLPCGVALRRLRLDYGLTSQTWGGYAADLVRSEVITIVVTSLGLLLLLACVRRFARLWPAVVGAVLAAFVVIGSFVYPVLIEPVFNDFEPLPDGQLREQIFALADQEGVQIDDVLVSDASRRTTTLNAYVSGFGSTRRVVVYDNLVDSLPEEETLSVVAHELAHAKHDDVVVGTSLGAAGTLVGVGLLSLVGATVRRRGAPGLGEAAAVPLVLALVALGSFVSEPVTNTISRQIETRADVDALRTTGDEEGFIGVQKQLALSSLADPDPWALTQFWFGSHPGVLTRIAIARRVLGE